MERQFVFFPTFKVIVILAFLRQLIVQIDCLNQSVFAVHVYFCTTFWMDILFIYLVFCKQNMLGNTSFLIYLDLKFNNKSKFNTSYEICKRLDLGQLTLLCTSPDHQNKAILGYRELNVYFQVSIQAIPYQQMLIKTNLFHCLRSVSIQDTHYSINRIFTVWHAHNFPYLQSRWLLVLICTFNKSLYIEQ